MMENKNGKNRVFSIELKSKNSLKSITLANGSNNSVLIEGTIGELVRATFAEGVVLEVVGKDGVLRLDLGEDPLDQPVDISIVLDQQNCPHLLLPLVGFKTHPSLKFRSSISNGDTKGKI